MKLRLWRCITFSLSFKFVLGNNGIDTHTQQNETNVCQEQQMQTSRPSHTQLEYQGGVSVLMWRLLSTIE